MYGKREKSLFLISYTKFDDYQFQHPPLRKEIPLIIEFIIKMKFRDSGTHIVEVCVGETRMLPLGEYIGSRHGVALFTFTHLSEDFNG